MHTDKIKKKKDKFENPFRRELTEDDLKDILSFFGHFELNNWAGLDKEPETVQIKYSDYHKINHYSIHMIYEIQRLRKLIK